MILYRKFSQGERSRRSSFELLRAPSLLGWPYLNVAESEAFDQSNKMSMERSFLFLKSFQKASHYVDGLYALSSAFCGLKKKCKSTKKS